MPPQIPADHLPGGQIIVSGNSNVTFYGPVVHNGDLFRVSAGSTAVFFGHVSGAGAFTGTGAKLFEGGYSPGNSPAAVSLDGHVAFTDSNTLFIEIGGLTPGTQFDQVNASGQLDLGGKLQVSLINGFHPQLGQTFDILNWGTVSGAFSSLALPAIPGGPLGWDTTQLYASGTLSVIKTYLQGDWNRDGQVTAADIPSMLSALTDLNAYKSTNALSPVQLASIGDFDSSGTVTNRDIQGLLDLVIAQGGGSAVSVPEPTAITIFALGLPALLLCGFRRRRAQLRG